MKMADLFVFSQIIPTRYNLFSIAIENNVERVKGG